MLFFLYYKTLSFFHSMIRQAFVTLPTQRPPEYNTQLRLSRHNCVFQVAWLSMKIGECLNHYLHPGQSISMVTSLSCTAYWQILQYLLFLMVLHYLLSSIAWPEPGFCIAIHRHFQSLSLLYNYMLLRIKKNAIIRTQSKLPKSLKISS